MKRLTALWLVLLCGLVFVGIPIAESRTLKLKVAGEILATNPDMEGPSLKLKGDDAFFKLALDEDEESKLVMDFDVETIGTVTNIVTNVTAIATAVLSNSISNVSLTTNSTTDQAISVSTSLAVCTDGSVTNLLTLTTSLLSDGAAFGMVVFSNSQLSVAATLTNATVDTFITFSTNVTTTCPGENLTETVALTTTLTNMVTTNMVTSLGGAISIDLVDADGFPLATLFEFPEFTAVESPRAGRMRIFALGEGFDSINHPVVGTVTFHEAVLTGGIEFDASNEVRRLRGKIHARGETDDGDVILEGKVDANNPFIPAE